jgi:predicted small lipoprotein YifL
MIGCGRGANYELPPNPLRKTKNTWPFDQKKEREREDENIMTIETMMIVCFSNTLNCLMVDGGQVQPSL